MSDPYGSTPCPIGEAPWNPAALAAVLEIRDRALVQALSEGQVPLYAALLALLAKGALSVAELEGAEQAIRERLADPGDGRGLR